MLGKFRLLIWVSSRGILATCSGKWIVFQSDYFKLSSRPNSNRSHQRVCLWGYCWSREIKVL